MLSPLSNMKTKSNAKNENTEKIQTEKLEVAESENNKDYLKE